MHSEPLVQIWFLPAGSTAARRIGELPAGMAAAFCAAANPSLAGKVYAADLNGSPVPAPARAEPRQG